MFVTMLVAVILRFTFANDSNFVWARYVYVIDIIMFYTRFLLLYHTHKRLGPQVAVMWRMVGYVSLLTTKNDSIVCSLLHGIKGV